MILASWLNSIGWASVLVFRELIQYPDGYLGMKWLSEVMNLPSETAVSDLFFRSMRFLHIAS